MRAPSPTFKSEIAAYRKQVASDQPHYKLILEILDRWSNHASAEAAWQTVQEKLSPTTMSTAEEFIYLVLVRRLNLKELEIRLREYPSVEAKKVSETKRLLKQRKYLQLAQENALLGYFQQGANRLVGREKNVRKIFVAGWSNKFRELCGQPLDNVVSVLTEVAFGGNTASRQYAARKRQLLGERAAGTPDPQNRLSVSS